MKLDRVLNNFFEYVKTSLIIALGPEETREKNWISEDEAETALVVIVPPAAPIIGGDSAKLGENRLSLLWHSKS